MPAVLELLPDVHEDDTQVINAKKVADLLKITLQDMADILEVNRSVLTRHPTASSIQPKLGQLVGIISSVKAELEGNLDYTRMWFRTGNRLMAGDTPLEALKKGKLDFLVRAVYRMESGDGL
jgi:hypothetical protein